MTLSQTGQFYRLFLVAGLILACGCQARTQHAAAPSPAQSTTLRTGDEGMWTLNNLPLAELKQRYNFEPSPQWVQHVQLSAVRVGGASGAFVSPNGLVITNHHVALRQLQKLSTPQKDYVHDGFHARAQSEELRCPDLELNMLVSMEDVTNRVRLAVDPKASDEDRNHQRKAEIARIEKESTDATKLRSDVVELYQGGEYWLYRYKKYTDVRLVLAPEIQAAFFGGDYDNFTYPRFCLDFTFFRVYENNQPARVEHYLKWSKAGADEGELVFVIGHPGHTNRLRAVSQLQYQRDFGLPTSLQSLNRRRKALYSYAARGTEQARQCQDQIFGVENSIKALTGYSEGLKDPSVFQRLSNAEAQLRKEAASRPDLTESTSAAWDRISSAVEKSRSRQKQSTYYSVRASQLADIAMQIVRYVAEVEKPNDKRYEEYRDSALDSLNHRLFSPAPIYPALDEHLLADALAYSREGLGPQDPFITTALNGREPTALARELIAGTRLADPAYRKELVKGGRQAVEKSNDALIQWARRIDPILRELRDWHENHVESVEVLEGAKIAQARFAIYGHNTYPDATGTLRISFGRVASYELGTTMVPSHTTLYGLLDRSASFRNKPPFDLPPAVAQNRSNINLATPLNFVTTNDIIGGNSGSPVVNQSGQYVGLIFDSNIQGLAGAFVYSDKTGRAIAVHSSAITEALRSIYPAPELLLELVGE